MSIFGIEVSIFWAFPLIVVGFVLLIKGADYLVCGASSLAKQLNISNLVIGLTVVAMGTSAPELVVSIISGAKEKQDIIFGNIIGSNIFNIFLILGVASVIYPISISPVVLKKDVPYCILSLVLLFAMVNDQLFWHSEKNILSLVDGIILISLFIIFLFHTFADTRQGISEESEEVQVFSGIRMFLYIVGGILGLVFGGNLVVENAVHVAEHFNVDEKIIGLTILAGGTSLPELATTVVASVHRKSELAIGNVLGSNIFNVLLVLGITSISSGALSPLVYDPKLNWDLYINFFGMGLLILFMYTFKGSKIDRVEGMVFLVSFVAYLVFLYSRL